MDKHGRYRINVSKRNGGTVGKWLPKACVGKKSVILRKKKEKMEIEVENGNFVEADKLKKQIEKIQSNPYTVSGEIERIKEKLSSARDNEDDAMIAELKEKLLE